MFTPDSASCDLAVVFPGQGSQRPGMAADFCGNFSVSREVFAEVGEALGLDMVRLCSGEDPRLALTEFTQPAILTAEIAMFRALVCEFGLRATLFGGHSLGEYTALCAAGVIPLADAVRAVCRRGAAMQRAVPTGAGGMLAVSGGGPHNVQREIRARFDLDVASFNSPHQIVLSGLLPNIARAERELATEGRELARLDVSAPFHSRFMRAVEPALRQHLDVARGRWSAAPAARVVSNARASFHAPDSASIAEALVEQLSAPVRWLENMNQLAGSAECIVEIGPSRPLKGLFRSIGREIRAVTSVRTAQRELCT